jgi:hypothetical protein
VVPIDQEYSRSTAVRLASTLPYRNDGGISQPRDQPPQLNMLHLSQSRPRRSTAAQKHSAAQQPCTDDDSKDSDYVAQMEDSGPSVDINLACQLCNGIEAWDLMLLCSKCNNGYHTFCVGLDEVPEGDWYCSPCLTKGKFPAKPPSRQPPTQPTEQYTTEDDWSSEDADDHFSEEDVESSTLKDITEDQPVLHFLKTGIIDTSHLTNASSVEVKNETKRIKKRACNYKWNQKESKLYKRATGRWPQDRIVISPGRQRQQLIDELHAELGHLGAKKVCSLLQTRYYWRNMVADVQTHLKTCNECRRTKTLFKLQPELQCLPPAKLWDRVHVDTLGPLPATRLQQNKYLFVACCAGSKYLEAQAFKEVNTRNWCRFLADIFSRWGVCNTIVSDNATYYTNSELQSFLKSLGVQHRFTSAYSPQSNGQAEAAVKILLNSLQRAVGNHPDSWDEKLPWTLLGVRNAKHSTTGYSPYFVMTGRHAVLPAERRWQLANADVPDPSSSALPADIPENQQQQTLRTPSQIDGKRAQNPGGSYKPTSRTNTPLIKDPNSPSPSEMPDWMQHFKPSQLNTTTGTNMDYVDLTRTSPEGGLGTDFKSFIDLRHQQSQQVQTQLEKHVLARQEKQKRDFKKRHHHTEPTNQLTIGSLVLMKNPAAQRSKLHKGLACEGPYRLVDLFPSTNPTLATLEDANNRRWKVNVKRLAPYVL